MKSFVITPANNQEAEFLASLFKKMKIKTSILDEDEKEEIALEKLMKEADRSKKVSREAVMKNLKS